MRDPNRIDEFILKVGEIWKEHCPDWRFGQLLSNMLPGMINNHGDMFFWEEEDFLKYLEEEFDGENE